MEKVRYYNTLRIEQIKEIHGDDFNIVNNKIVFKDRVINSIYTPYQKIISDPNEKKDDAGHKKFGGRKYETRE